MAVESQAIAKGAQGRAVGVIAARRQTVGSASPSVWRRSTRRRACSSSSMNAGSVIALAGIGGDFADAQRREAPLKILETRDRLQVVIAVGGDHRAGQGPVGEQAVVQDLNRFGLVAKVGLALGRAFGCGVLVWPGARPIRAGVVNVSGLRVAGGGIPTVVGARVRRTGTTGLASRLRRTSPLEPRRKAGGRLVAAAQMRAGGNQLAIGGDAVAALGGSSGKVAWVGIRLSAIRPAARLSWHCRHQASAVASTAVRRVAAAGRSESAKPRRRR